MHLAMVRVCCLLLLHFCHPVWTFCPTSRNVGHQSRRRSIATCYDRNSLAKDFRRYGKEKSHRQRVSNLSAASTDQSRSSQKIPLRQWNLNRQGSPFGFDLNAEVWNGRVAMISFMWVLIQELISGKGILPSIVDEDGAAVAALGLFIVGIMSIGARFAVEPEAGTDYRKPSDLFVKTTWRGPPFESSQGPPFESSQAATYRSTVQDQKPHPDEFQFKRNIVLISKVLKDVRSRLPVSSASPYPVQGFSFKPDVRTVVKKGERTLNPNGTFRFQDEYIVNDTAQKLRRRNEMEAIANFQPWPVKSFDFPQSTKSVINDWKATPLHHSPPSNQINVPSIRDEANLHLLHASVSERKDQLYETENSNSFSHYAPVEDGVSSIDDSFLQQQKWAGSASYLDSLCAGTVAPQMNTLETLSMNTLETSLTGSDSFDRNSYAANQASKPVYDIPPSTQPYAPPLSDGNSYRDSVSKSSVEEYGPGYDSSRWSLELAELFNGRIAKIAFVMIFGQELLQGKGIFQGISEKDPFNIGALVISTIAIVSTTTYFFTELVEEVPQFGFNPKAHPEYFQFNKDIVLPRRKVMRMPVSSASPYPVQGFNFNEGVRSLAKKTEMSPHPGGSFRFQDKYIVDQTQLSMDNRLSLATEPRANVQPWPVASFDFPDSTKAIIKEWQTTPMHSTWRDQVHTEATHDINLSSPESSYTDNAYGYGAEVLSTLASADRMFESDERIFDSSQSIRWTTVPGGSYLDSLSSTTMMQPSSGAYLDSLSSTTMLQATGSYNRYP